MTSIVRYRMATDEWTTHRLLTPHESVCTELCTLDDGYSYVAVPDGVTLPTQPAPIAISVEAVMVTAQLREQINAASPHCRLIADRMIEKIRERYSVDDELFFARIMVGAGAGIYEMQAGEMEEVLAYKAHVESVRQWGRDQRALLGL